MSTKEKLLKKAQENPKNLTFKEFQSLLEDYGFIKRRSGGGSHFTYTRNERPIKTIPIQKMKGKAKPYQIKQFLDWAEDEGLIKMNEAGKKEKGEQDHG